MESKIAYQIYPKSFMDSNGDGVGDIQGIISKLDYLQELGIDILWITPIFKSPQNDNGYDVSNYYEIEEVYGTEEDVDQLIKEAKKREIIIMFDMVFNHSSTHHEWFQKAIKGDQKYIDRYFFTKEKYNWESKFGGNAFEYIDSLDMYYLHLFDKSQADLNWDNTDVFKELVNICNFWLKKGIRGFRFDVINLISKPEVFKDSGSDGKEQYTDGEKVTEYIRKLGKQSFHKYKDVYTVGELSSTSVEKASQYSRQNETGLSTIFNFHHLKVDYKDGYKWGLKDFDFLELKNLYREWQLGMIKNSGSMALFMSNHDQPRSISRFTDESFEGQTMLTNLIISLKGVVFFYQGEEIGLPNAYFTDIDEYRDVESINYYKILKEKYSETEVLKILSERSRDNGRTPMPWNKEINYGFTSGEPWIGFSKSPNMVDVDSNLNDTNSIWHYTKKAIEIRKTDEILIKGNINFIDLEHESLFIFERILKDEKYLCIHNFYDQDVNYNFEYDEVILSNYNDTINNIIRPYESIILKCNFNPE